MSEVISLEMVDRAHKLCEQLNSEGLSGSTVAHTLAVALALAIYSTDKQAPLDLGIVLGMTFANKFDLEVTKQGEIS